MKKWLLLLMLLPCVVAAGDLTLIYIDTINAADTANGVVRCDTVYSSAERLAYGGFGPNIIHFFSILGADGVNTDTNWADDTFFVKFQTSCDRSTWDTREVDTLLTNGSGWSSLVIDADTSYFGDWGRAMLIHWDTLAADDPDLLNNTYHKKLQLWISPKY